MKKLRILCLSAVGALSILGGMTSCNKANTNITIWVGDESTEFYTKKAEEFLKEHENFGFTIQVIGSDTGTAGGSMTTDNSACGDIVTMAHDNIGKTLEKNLILSFDNEELITQVNNDNSDEFKNVIYYDPNSTGTSSLYGVPYISQALFLYYNKAKVTEEQAKTFEGLEQAAAAAGARVKAFTITGTDGYNYSFNLLARKASDNSTTLKLFPNFKGAGTYVQGDDEVASLNWAHRVFNEDNGGMMPNDSGWAVNVSGGNVLSVIGGAWHYNAAAQAFGESNLGIAKLPTYTLIADDVAGTSITSGTVMQAGTFADCKVFVMNAAASANKYDAMQEIIKYFSSKEVQLESFIEANNVPSYIGASDDIDAHKSEVSETQYNLALAQNEMIKYGIPQPFIKGTLNTRFYSLDAPDYYKNAINSTEYVSSTATGGTARETLYTMNYIYIKGTAPTSVPAVLPADII